MTRDPQRAAAFAPTFAMIRLQLRLQDLAHELTHPDLDALRAAGLAEAEDAVRQARGLLQRAAMAVQESIPALPTQPEAATRQAEL